MNPRFSRWILAALTALCSIGPGDRPAQPMSVLVLRCDQLRASALGCYGDPDAITPSIDALAARSVRFTHAYATEPVCSAHRTAFDVGLHTHATPNLNKLHPDDETLHRMLHDAGWSTFRIGKWHLTPDNLKNPLYPEHVPQEILVGVDHHAGHEQSHELVNSYYYVNGSYAAKPGGPWRPQTYVDLLKDRLTALAAAGQPFFGIVDLEPPHTPYGPIHGTPWDAFEPGDVPAPPNVPAAAVAEAEAQLADYYSFVHSLDDLVGQVVLHLRATGLWDETIVIFTADHGAHVGAHGYVEVEDQKSSFYDEAVHVPLLWYDPHAAPAVDQGLFGTVDFKVKILERLGFEPPAGLHGLAHPENGLYFQQYFPENTPDGAWRGILRADGVKYARSENSGPWVMFDTRVDPYEQDNLIGTGDPREPAMEALLWEAARLVGDPILW